MTVPDTVQQPALRGGAPRGSGARGCGVAATMIRAYRARGPTTRRPGRPQPLMHTRLATSCNRRTGVLLMLRLIFTPDCSCFEGCQAGGSVAVAESCSYATGPSGSPGRGGKRGTVQLRHPSKAAGGAACKRRPTLFSRSAFLLRPNMNRRVEAADSIERGASVADQDEIGSPPPRCGIPAEEPPHRS